MDKDIWEIVYNYRAVEADLSVLLRYVDLNKSNDSVNSAEIRKIILLACSMIESLIPSIKTSLSIEKLEPNKKEKENIADCIKRVTSENGYLLEALQPILSGQKFDPWKEPSSWWKIYNDIKHSEQRSLDPKPYKAAIDSVLALFVLTVLLTRETSIEIFWHKSDLVRISRADSQKPIQYDANKTLDAIIWSDNKIK